MSKTLFKPSRCVLLIGDDALYVYNITLKASQLLEAIPWEDENLQETVADYIKKECAGKPVLILNDMTDQHFKGGQRLPKVGPLDKSSVLQRRLHVAFPNFPIRGALPIKGEQRLYLFSAVPMSEPILKTFDAVRRSMAPVAGFCLLPIEAADMVKQLSDSISKRSGDFNQWTVFIGQHQNGSLRQVITRNGQLAMTRMTPVVEMDEGAEEWSTEVSQEFKATISYLSRFGYSQEDGTQVIVIATPEAGQALESKIDIPCSFASMTSNEAARLLGTAIGAQTNPNYAEPLHAAWAGRKHKLTLPMEASDLAAIHKPRQMATVFIFICMLLFGYMGWLLLDQIQSMYSLRDDLQTKERQLAQVEIELQDEHERMKSLGFDVNLIEGSLTLFNKLENEQLRSLPLILNIGKALGPDLRLESLDVRYIPPPPKSATALAYQQVDEEELGSELSASLQLSFPPTVDIEVSYGEVRDLARRLGELLPSHSVEIARQVAGRDYKSDFKGEVGVNKNAAASSEYEAEISIKGPAQ
jgi:hypothetical protein